MQELSSGSLGTPARRILSSPGYRTGLVTFQQLVEQTTSLDLAADLAESSLREAGMNIVAVRNDIRV